MQCAQGGLLARSSLAPPQSPREGHHPTLPSPPQNRHHRSTALGAWPPAVAAYLLHSAVAGNTAPSRPARRWPCSDPETWGTPPARFPPCSTRPPRRSVKPRPGPLSTAYRKIPYRQPPLACPSRSYPGGRLQRLASTSQHSPANTAMGTRCFRCTACRRSTAPRGPRGPRAAGTAPPAPVVLATAPLRGPRRLRPLRSATQLCPFSAIGAGPADVRAPYGVVRRRAPPTTHTHYCSSSSTLMGRCHGHRRRRRRDQSAAHDHVVLLPGSRMTTLYSVHVSTRWRRSASRARPAYGYRCTVPCIIKCQMVHCFISGVSGIHGGTQGYCWSTATSTVRSSGVARVGTLAAHTAGRTGPPQGSRRW
eukprot:COSAG02_NODE_1632_length_11568_cov_4.882640_5_plen_364_part_00